VGAPKALKNPWQPFSGDERRHILQVELARVNGGLSPQDRREKYRRMSESAFAFYRGTAHLFYRDLAANRLPMKSDFFTPQTQTWIMGDLHINNFGAFRDAAGDVVYDLNDFDEAWVASYLYDLWRGAASLVISGLAGAFETEDIKDCVDTFALRYLLESEKYADTDAEHLDKVTAQTSTGKLSKWLAKQEEKRSRQEMLDEWTCIDAKGKRYFNLDNEELHPVDEDDQRILRRAIEVYKDHLAPSVRDQEGYFEVLDCAQRLGAGVGSLGTLRYYVLIQGPDETRDTSIILDVKQQGLPSFFNFMSAIEQEELLSMFDEMHSGARVAHAQKAMHNDPDPHVGWVTVLGRPFSVRQRSPYKKRFKQERLRKAKDFKAMSHAWGTALATAHARGDLDNDDGMVHHCFETEIAALVKGHEKAFCKEVRHFALAYAEQVMIDYELFEAMRESGEI
jgi:uncharacterized protein (DUF2252 family)